MSEDLLNRIKDLVDQVLANVDASHKEENRDRKQRHHSHANRDLRKIRLLIEEHQEAVTVPRQEFHQREEGQGCHRDLVETHESYGVVSVTRPQGRIRLVGAMMDALPCCVNITVHRAQRTINQDLHTEHFFHRGPPVLQIRMSTYQWAEAISSMNGVAVPCTIENIMGVNMDDVPEETKTPLEQLAHRTKTQAQAQETAAEGEFFKAVDALIAEVPGLKLSKKREVELMKTLQNLKGHVNAPKEATEWASRRLAEDTEKAVAQGRVELAAALTTVLQRAGLGALAEKHQLNTTDLNPNKLLKS